MKREVICKNLGGLAAMNRATFLTTLDLPWTQMEPVRLGRVASGGGTPDRFMTVESSEGPLLRVDLYRSSDECFAFDDVCIWSRVVAIGWGHHLYMIDPRTRATLSLDLGAYFGHVYPVEQYLLVASAESLFRIDSDGSLLWRADHLGIDGVVVERVEMGVIKGQGEWNPPGGWLPFQVNLDTGQRA